jgi:hypothetical protein
MSERAVRNLSKGETQRTFTDIIESGTFAVLILVVTSSASNVKPTPLHNCL